MDINEFNIACKLIMLKLRGVDIPKALPPQMLMPAAAPPMPQMVAAPVVPPMVPAAPVIPAMMPAAPIHAPIVPAAPIHAPTMVAAPIYPPMMPPPMVAAQPPAIIPMQMNVAQAQMMQQVPLVPGLQMASQAPLAHAPMHAMEGAQQMMSPVMTEMPLAQQQQPAEMIANKQRSASVASVELGASLDWAVPHQSKLRYTQVFNSNDRTRCGHLTGAQARNILIQWGIPQAALAKIW